MFAASLFNAERSYLSKGLATSDQNIHQTRSYHDFLGRDFHFRSDVGRACPSFNSCFFTVCNGGHDIADRALSTKRLRADGTQASSPADHLPQPHGCIQL